MTRSTAQMPDPRVSHVTAPRLFVPDRLRAGADIAVPDAQAHYLGTVLRRQEGAPVRVFNGLDGEWLARIGFARRCPTLTVDEQLRGQTAEPGPWLVFALLKRDATDLVVRQAVELGASRILPVITERTNAARVNQDRLRAIAVEAAEQCERLTVPPVEPPSRLETVLSAWPTGRRLFAAFERSDSATPPHGPDPAALLIGPEGGFTPHEQDMLRRLPFVVPLSLGPFVLRAETAAAAGQALLLQRGWGEYPGST